MDSSAVREQALAALRRADVDAGRAAPFAERAVRRATAARDDVAASVAERAWGRAVLQCGDVENAIRHLRRSVVLAERVGAADLAGEARVPLAAALVQRGRAGEALREIDTAVHQLVGSGNARARAQRADLLHQIGRLSSAQAEYDAAIPLLRRAGDDLNLQRALVNRGILDTERHAFIAAETSLREADKLARAMGRRLAVGIIAENLGFLETLRGEVPAALEHLGRAERTIGELGGQLGPVYSDQAELLLSVGAHVEAAEAAYQAVLAFERERRRLLVPGARLLLAQAAFLSQDWPIALEQARRAGREFARQDRREWAELARLAVLRTQLASSGRTTFSTARVMAMVEILTTAGWPAAALEARLVAARISANRGDHVVGAACLREAGAAVRRGPATLRARAWYARASLAWRSGDDTSTIRAVRAGLSILDEHAASLGATDLRAHSAVHRSDLSELGLRVAMRSGRPGRVFEWAERGRATRLANRPLRPPEDPEIRALLAELRATSTEIRNDSAVKPRIRARQAVLERRIRDRARLDPGAPDHRQVRPVKPSELDLGDAALVEFVQLNGTLHALSLVHGRLRLRSLGASDRIAGLVDRMTFALRRLARRADGAPTRAAALTLLDHAGTELDRALLRSLPEIGERPLVVVPTGPLHSVAWSALPSCSGRPVTVCPSATLWHSAATTGRAPLLGVVSVAAGPGLAGAYEEAQAVAALHGTTPLVGRDATVEAVLKVVATSDVLHLAAHGRLAVDQPLLSDLRLADGPLVVYDLERLDRVPRMVVLASCESGRSVVCTGDELLGLSATFIALGTTQLVASVLAVPDAETAPLMVAFHEGLVAGRPPAVALAEAQESLRGNGTESMLAVAAFSCFGAGY